MHKFKDGEKRIFSIVQIFVDDLLFAWKNKKYWFMQGDGVREFDQLDRMNQLNQYALVKGMSSRLELTNIVSKQVLKLSESKLSEFLRLWSCMPFVSIELHLDQSHSVAIKVIENGSFKFYDSSMPLKLNTFSSSDELIHFIKNVTTKTLNLKFDGSIGIRMAVYNLSIRTGESDRLELDKERVNALYEEIRRNSPNGWTPLHAAIYFDNLEMLERCLQDKTIDLNKADSSLETPISLAIKLGRVELAKCLIQQQNIQLKGALQLAISTKKIDIVKLLIRGGADVNEIDIYQPLQWRNPFFLAIFDNSLNDVELVKLMLENGANFMKGLSIEQAFDLICEIPNGSIICEILDHILKKEEDINNIDEKGRTLLHCAAERDHESLVEVLITNGADPKLKDLEGKSVFEYAAGKSCLSFL